MLALEFPVSEENKLVQNFELDVIQAEPWGEVLPIMADTGRLRLKGERFLGFRYIKGWGFH